jgi:hypothetical protein
MSDKFAVRDELITAAMKASHALMDVAIETIGTELGLEADHDTCNCALAIALAFALRRSATIDSRIGRMAAEAYLISTESGDIVFH